MGRPAKGVNTFKLHQDAKQDHREDLIRNYLKVLRRSRASFKYPTDLAKAVAVHISEVEKKPCNHSTILRNLRYRGLVFSYQAEEMLPGARNVEVPVQDFVAQAAITQLQLENRNVLGENRRLKLYIGTLESEHRAKPALPSVQVLSGEDFEERFVLTCQALQKVIDSLGGVIKVDTDAMQIIDDSRRLDKTVADERIAKPFISWYLGNRKE